MTGCFLVHIAASFLGSPVTFCFVDMKSLTLLAAVCATAVFAEPKQLAPRAITIEVAPGETRQITEEERWELSTVSNKSSSLRH
jgi:hypothetical protein